MEILNFNTLIEAVLIVLLYLYYRLVPNNGEMYLKVKHLEKVCNQLSEMLEVDRAEMWEHIEGTLKPLTNRMTTRIKRAKQAEEKEEKELKAQESSEKTGLIYPGIHY